MTSRSFCLISSHALDQSHRPNHAPLFAGGTRSKPKITRRGFDTLFDLFGQGNVSDQSARLFDATRGIQIHPQLERRANFQGLIRAETALEHATMLRQHVPRFFVPNTAARLDRGSQAQIRRALRCTAQRKERTRDQPHRAHSTKLLAPARRSQPSQTDCCSSDRYARARTGLLFRRRNIDLIELESMCSRCAYRDHLSLVRHGPHGSHGKGDHDNRASSFVDQYP